MNPDFAWRRNTSEFIFKNAAASFKPKIFTINIRHNLYKELHANLPKNLDRDFHQLMQLTH